MPPRDTVTGTTFGPGTLYINNEPIGVVGAEGFAQTNTYTTHTNETFRPGNPWVIDATPRWFGDYGVERVTQETVGELRNSLCAQIEEMKESIQALQEAFSYVIHVMRDCAKNQDLVCEDGGPLDEFLEKFEVRNA